jgi:NitT/TauT family transport system substrate-binding protein
MGAKQRLDPARGLLRGLIFMAVPVAALLGGAASAQAPKPVQVRVTAQDSNASATPFFLAQELGYFRDAGLEVSFVTMAGGDVAMAAALKTGQLDIAVGGATQFMGDLARGVTNGRIVGELTDNNYAILANGITDPKQLKGRNFGISGINGGDHLYVVAVLQHYGIGPDDMNWVPLGVPASRLAGLLAGKVDAIQMVLTSLPDSAKGKVIIGPDDSPVPFVSNAIFANYTLLDSNKPALQKFLAAIGKASEWARAHPDQAVPACLKSGAPEAACKLAIEVAVASKNPYTWSATSRVNTDGIQAMIPVIAAIVPKAKTMSVADFVDKSVAATP